MAAQSLQGPEVALAPFAVLKDSTGALRPAADACLDQLATALAAKGIRITRLPALDERSLARAQPARWAVLGKFKWDKGQAQAELRLMEVSTGDEMRYYFKSDPDPQKLIALGDGAAERIALHVKEKRDAAEGR
jgi:TolB-like protein